MSSVRMRAPEVRTYQFRMTDIDTDDALRFIEGRAVPYDTDAMVGWYWERMAAGVFAESLAARAALPLLLWHNGRTWPVGVAAEWNDTDDGLHGVWRLDDSTDAQRAARQARDGFLTGLSVGFDPRKSNWTYTPYDEWNPDDPDTYDRCTRETARLVEVSMCPAPAYDDAGVTLVRSADRRMRYAGRPTTTAAPAARTAGAAPVATPHLDRWRAYRRTLDPR